MNILITNDDGYLSPGIKMLAQKLKEKHNVYTSAPLTQKSASGHSITLFKRMEIKKVNDTIYAVDGTPADSVKVGLFGIYLNVQFDLVISGINNGPNMGEDIFYSGTVAGAREGLISGLFSIACSSDCWEKKDAEYYQKPAEFIVKLVDALTPDILKEKIILNINFPNTTSFKGVKITHLGKRIYRDYVHFENVDDKTFAMVGGETPAYDSVEGSDLNCVNEGFISITPLSNELFEELLINKIKVLEKIKV